MFRKFKQNSTSKDSEKIDDDVQKIDNAEPSSQSSFIIIMSIIFIIFGIVVSTNFKKYIKEAQSNLPAARRLDELVMILKDTQEKKYELEAQLEELKLKIKKISTGSKSQLASTQLKRLYEKTGIVTTTGKGLEININSSVVTGDDILKLVNELKAGGAVAISVNDERLVTTSEIVNVGNSIVINKTKLIPPYVVRVVGPTDILIPTLRLRGGVVEYFQVLGINLNILEKENLKIPPYKHEL